MNWTLDISVWYYLFLMNNNHILKTLIETDDFEQHYYVSH